jgi:hypothetical protein
MISCSTIRDRQRGLFEIALLAALVQPAGNHDTLAAPRLNGRDQRWSSDSYPDQAQSNHREHYARVCVSSHNPSVYQPWLAIHRSPTGKGQKAAAVRIGSISAARQSVGGGGIKSVARFLPDRPAGQTHAAAFQKFRGNA